MDYEIRQNEDGTVDEVVCKECCFHLEQMDDGCWWVGLTMPSGERVRVVLSTKRNAPIHCLAEPD